MATSAVFTGLSSNRALALSTITDAMYNEPLSFEVVPGSTADTRIFRLHGPITLSNLFDFQKVLTAGTEKSPSSTLPSPNTSTPPGWASSSIITSPANATAVPSGWLRSITGLPSC